ncbi:MAG: hypothetical protein U0894_14475 [Pirellulales bacterium]
MASVGTCQEAASVSYLNDVVPVFTKAGCNAGVCHAKANTGQNGFRLSLLGFEAKDDYDHLVHEGRGRRLFLADANASLLLLKASGKVPHGGGVRLSEDSGVRHSEEVDPARGFPMMVTKHQIWFPWK